MSETSTSESIPVDTQHGDDVDVRSIVVWGLVSISITMTSIFGLYAVYNTFAAEQRVVKTYDGVDGENPKFQQAEAKIHDQEGLLLEPPHWLDTEGNTVSVPLDRAESIVLKEFQREE